MTVGTRKPHRRVLRRFIVLFAMGILFASLSDHLPMGEAGKRLLTRIWMPLLTADYPDSGREQVSVVLLDDTDLAKYGETWPATMGFHQRRLEDLLRYKPKAVFFDIVFLDDRDDPELGGFIDAACRARLAGVPVFIGAFRAPGPDSRTQRQMLGSTVQAGGLRLPCIEAAYLTMAIDRYDQSVWEYELALTGTGKPALSPAAALYSVGLGPKLGPQNAPMALIWGAASHPTNLDWMRTGDGDGADSCRASWSWSRVVPLAALEGPLCPYQRTLPMRTLKKSEGFSQAELADAIGGKYIIYGTDLQSAGDVIVSPYHGRVPGAYLHAMALDNLLSFKGRPKLAGEFGQNVRVTWATLFAVALISACFAARLYWPGLQDRQLRLEGRALGRLLRWRRWPRLSAAARTAWYGVCQMAGWLATRSIWLMVALLPIHLLLWISYSWLDLGPLVWIEYVLFPLSMEFLELGERAEEGLLGVRARFRRERDDPAAAA